METAKLRQRNQLSAGAKLLYGLCLMGGNFVYMITATYITTYYQIYLGLNPAFVGLILLIARVFDAVNDPLTGIIVQKVNFKSGKYRPWLISGSIINGLVLVALFAVPKSLQGAEAMTGKMIWFTAAYLMWSITYDMFDIPIWSVIPAVTKEGKERESMASIGRTFAGIGCGIVSALGLTLSALLGGGETYSDRVRGFMWFAVLIFVYYVVFTLIFCKVLKGKDNRNVETEESISVGQMFKALLHNSQALVVALSIVITNLAIYFSTSFIQYYLIFDFDMGDSSKSDGDYALVTMVMFGAQVLGMALIYPLFSKFIKRKPMFIGSLIFAIIGYGVLLGMTLTNVGDITLLLIPCVVIGIVTGLLNVMTTVFLADSIDYGEFKNGHREESVICSLQTFVVKLASGLTAGASGLVLTLISFDTTENAVNTPEALQAMRITMSGVPIIFLVIGIIIFAAKFILNENKMKEISDALAQNKTSDTEKDESAEETASEAVTVESRKGSGIKKFFVTVLVTAIVAAILGALIYFVYNGDGGIVEPDISASQSAE